MRWLFLALFVGGLGLAAFPWFSDNVLAREIGIWRVYDDASGFLPAQARLAAEDAPLTVLVDMAAIGPANAGDDRALLTLTADAGGRTVLAKTLTFADASPRDTNPQTGEKAYREIAGVIESVEPGLHVFTLGMGDAEGVSVRWVDLVLKRGGAAYDTRAQPLGFSLMAVGFIGLVLSLRRRRDDPPDNPNAQPPRPRWGRGASSPR
jgi:hypothetical protein